jgi:hypothetical protein
VPKEDGIRDEPEQDCGEHGAAQKPLSGWWSDFVVTPLGVMLFAKRREGIQVRIEAADYLDAAKERLKNANLLYEAEQYSFALYAAGVAVESLRLQRLRLSSKLEHPNGNHYEARSKGFGTGILIQRNHFGACVGEDDSRLGHFKIF